MDDFSGRVIKGYELRERIGAGGSGAVYRAFQTLVGRDVAIKIILPQYANHPDFVRRFETEAQLVARLEHPHIVPLYDYWREPGGAYLVMRWLKGGSLQSRIDSAQPLSLEALVQVFEQILPALAVAHRHGVVHRDLKPANILLDDDQNAYLADFGIAKDLGNRNTAYQTQTGVLGSPAYLSPEQIYSKPVTPQTDIYSLGVLMYEALVGDLPFQETSLVALLYKHMNEPLPSVLAKRPDLPEAVDMIIQRASAKTPGDRYSDVHALLADLRALTHGGSTALLPPMEVGASTRITPSDRRRRTSGVVRRETGFETMVLDIGAVVVENPYKGLRAFHEADATDFFGREVLTQHLLNKMAEPGPLARFLAVVGPSGSGKSSVVRAGVVPALRKGALPNADRWFIVEMLPGTNPLVELEAALLRVAVNPPINLLQQLEADDGGLLRVVKQILPPDPETELVLVIDQFEEIFTLAQDDRARDRIINGIFHAVTTPYSRLRIIVTLRADFYDRPLLYPQVSELFRQRTEVVVPLTNEELERAIVQPAAQVGLMLEAELIAAMIHDVGEQPGALPLLQYALTELVERRQGRVLTVASYRDSGGVLGALARRADELYEQLNPDEQEVARQLFLRLVTLGEGTEDTRRRVQQTELASIAGGGPLLDGVIAAYNKYRLLSFDRDPITRSPTIEVAHEALIRTWNRLREWLASSREDLRLQRRLAAAAAEWASSGRDHSFLASGTRLDQFEEWVKTTHLALNAEERAYLDASLAERDVRQRAEEARAAHELDLERRSRRFLRALVAVLLIAFVGSLGLAGFAFTQRQAAQRSADEATAARAQAEADAIRAQRGESAAVAAEAEANEQAEIARANAAEAQNLALAAGAQSAFSQGNNDLALTLATVANQIEPPLAQEQLILANAAYAPGTRFSMTGHEDTILAVDVSPDGAFAASGGRDALVLVWDLATGKEVRKLEGHEETVGTLAWSPDGTTIASGSNDSTVILWDAASTQQLRKLDGHDQDVAAVAWSPDSKFIVSGSNDTTLILWDATSGQQVRTFNGHTQEVTAAAWSPDGQQLVSGSRDSSLIIWNVATGEPIRTLNGHSQAVNGVAWSPDGKTILSGSIDTTLILWDAATGEQIRTLAGHTRDVWAVAFSPDSQRAASASREGRIGLWDLATGQSIRFLTGHGSDVQAVKFLPNGNGLVSGSLDRTVRLWDLQDGSIQATFSGHGDRVNKVTLSPDGTLLLSSSGDRTLILWDATTGEELFRFAGHNDAIGAVAWSPDGKFAVSGANAKDGTLIIWDIQQRQVLKVLNQDKKGHTKEISGVAWAPNGKTLLSGSGDNEQNLILWDVASGQQIRSFKGHEQKVNAVAFSPDGTQALSASRDKNIILWDVASGQQVRTLSGHTANVRSVVFSPDGTRALSGADDKHVILWDVASGEPIRTFVGHNALVWDAAFSPDGALALSGSDDLSMIMWDVATGAAVRRFEGHRASVRSVAWSHDGKAVFSASNDRMLLRWRVDTLPELLQWAQANRYIAPLTCDQQTLYKLEQSCTEAASAVQ